MNSVNERGQTVLSHTLSCPKRYAYLGIMKLLLKNGADVHAAKEEDGKMKTPLYYAAVTGRVTCVLILLCFGAEISHELNEMAIDLIYDQTRILDPINERLNSLRVGNGMETTLMSEEERRFMWNLAFSFTIKYRVAAFKAYYSIRSFITYNGIFMGAGYDLGDCSVWRKVDC